MSENGILEGVMAYFKRYCPTVCMEGLKNITSNPSEDIQSPDQESNQGLSEYKVSTIKHRRMVFNYYKACLFGHKIDLRQ
jgi:hypothetical protein